METYRKPIITGQQKILLNKFKNGKVKATDLYGLLRSRVNEIPYRLVKSGSDEECINWFIEHATVYTDVHKSINWWARYKATYNKSRFQHWVYKNK